MEALLNCKTTDSNVRFFPDLRTIAPMAYAAEITDSFPTVSISIEKTSSANGVISQSNQTKEEGKPKMEDQDIIIKYLDILDKDRRDMEARLCSDKKASEDRIQTSLDKSEERIQSALDKIEKGQTSVKKEVRTLTIALILGVAAMAVAITVAIPQIITQVISLIK